MGVNVVKLGELCEILDSKRKPVSKKDRVAGEYPYYGATGIQDYVANYIFDESLVLVGEDGAKWGAGENTAYAISGKSWVNNHAHVLRPNRNKILDNYLIYYLNQMDLRPYITGAIIEKLNQEQLRNIEIPLPSIEEQTLVVSLMDKADEIRTKKRLANDKLDEFLRSTFISMFGDSKGNPNGFELKELQTISNVGSSKRVFVNELVEKGIPFYRGTEIGALAEGKEISPELFITEEHYKELCDCTGKVNQGDLLLPSICPDGRIWQVQNNTEFYFKDGRVLWIRPNAGENSTYIRYALKELFQSDYTHIASGTTFAELKIFILKTLNIMYPPMELQNKFAKIVEKVEAQKQKNEQVIEQMDNLFNSLSQQAFKGEL